MPDDELKSAEQPAERRAEHTDEPTHQSPGPPSELSALSGIRPDMERPRPLRVPSSPQREHIMAEAEALRRYVEEGGAVLYVRSNRADGRARLRFEVERGRFNRIAGELRAERTGNGPWIWTPKRGLHRGPFGA